MTDSLKTQVAEALDFARAQLRRLTDAGAPPRPLYTERGKWQAADATGGSQDYLRATLRLLTESDASDAADIQDRDTVTEATATARTIARTFQPNGQYLASEFGSETLRIDSMMGVGSLFTAARNPTGGSADLVGPNAHEMRRRAIQHCLTVQRVLCRGDGSVGEEGIFDPRTGEFLRQAARRAFRADSCWSLGLARSMYGFAACHELTGDRRLLKTAEDHAEFWTTATPDQGVPPWDFDAPLDGRLTLTQPDSAAAAVAASALFTLARLTHDRIRARAYEEFALRTVDTLTKPPYLATDDPSWQGIIRRAVYDMPGGVGVDESVIWGDYFAVEAMTGALALL